MIAAQTLDLCTGGVEVGGQLPYALAGSLEFTEDTISLDPNGAERGRVITAQTLDLCTGGVEVGGQLPYALAGSLEFTEDTISLGLNGAEHGGAITAQTLDLCAGGVQVGGQALNVGPGSLLLSVEPSTQLPYALPRSLEFSGNTVLLGLSGAERGGASSAQTLDLCAGGVEVGAQLLDGNLGLRTTGLGSGVLIADALKIGLEIISVGGQIGGGGVNLGQLGGQVSDLLLSGIAVGRHPISFRRNLGQSAVQLLGRLSRGGDQVSVASLAGSKLVVQELELGLSLNQIGAQMRDLVLGCI